MTTIQTKTCTMTRKEISESFNFKATRHTTTIVTNPGNDMRVEIVPIENNSRLWEVTFYIPEALA